jgi:SAM-dependent methyltransferase
MEASDMLEARRLSFGAAAELYDSARPPYPPEAARWMLGARRCRVADLGAGTGIFTRLLVALGHDVVAVEPDPGMRARLRERSPEIEVVAGSAEEIPLADASLDAVTAAQSHHWFNHAGAHAEIARVLRPGGVFAPIWNLRDDSVGWVAELAAAARLSEDNAGEARRREREHGDFGPLFDTPETAEFRHTVVYDAETLLALVRSRSQYLVAPPEEQEQISQAVRLLTSRLPARIELPYLTRALKARRRP